MNKYQNQGYRYISEYWNSLCFLGKFLGNWVIADHLKQQINKIFLKYELQIIYIYDIRIIPNNLYYDII